MALAADSDEFEQYQRLAGTTKKRTVRVDKNLDGKFDDKDKDLKFDLNFGVLCTGTSYSCGNYITMLMEKAGFSAAR